MSVAPGRGCGLVFQYSSVGVTTWVCVYVCDQNTQYLSITQPDMKGVCGT